CIGMSTVPEVIMAKYLGMNCLGISVVSNVFNENSIKETSFEAVIETVEIANKKLSLLLSSLINEFA
ncbi:MAG TPA: purine-nucleoside phosphorylase, partial [Bacteroidetes bacterium]|nr:purine-nucleoside phosphorylase [Bacteroidota bacterium]